MDMMLDVMPWMMGYVALVFATMAAAAVSMVFLGIWAYRDAKSRNIDTPVLWGFIVVLVPWFIGGVIYLVMRGSYPVVTQCTNCGATVRQDANFCAGCGAAVEAQTKTSGAKRMLIAFFIALGAAVVMGIVAVIVFFSVFFGVMDYTWSYGSMQEWSGLSALWQGPFLHGGV